MLKADIRLSGYQGVGYQDMDLCLISRYPDDLPTDVLITAVKLSNKHI